MPTAVLVTLLIGAFVLMALGMLLLSIHRLRPGTFRAWVQAGKLSCGVEMIEPVEADDSAAREDQLAARRSSRR